MYKKIFLAADHGGFKLKKYLKLYLEKSRYTVIDMGNHQLDKTDDYSDFVIPAVRKAVKTRGVAIVICRSGVGSCIVANKVKGAFAVLTDSAKLARQSREHNNTNVLCLGADFVKTAQAARIVRTWLSAEFKKGRHVRRLRKIKSIEK